MVPNCRTIHWEECRKWNVLGCLCTLSFSPLIFIRPGAVLGLLSQGSAAAPLNERKTQQCLKRLLKSYPKEVKLYTILHVSVFGWHKCESDGDGLIANFAMNWDVLFSKLHCLPVMNHNNQQLHWKLKTLTVSGCINYYMIIFLSFKLHRI